MNEQNESENFEVMPPSATALESITRAEVDMQIVTAHRYPRNMTKFLQSAERMATGDIDTAESCLYSRPVGKGPDGQQKYAEGMSVRMAEIVGACYGNLRVSTVLIEKTDRYVRVRGIAHDLESNFAASSEVVEATVKKGMNGQPGLPYDERMRVVIEKACHAKAFRDAVFKVVPRALAKPVEKAVIKLLTDKSALTFDERRKVAERWLDGAVADKKLSDKKLVWKALGINGPADLTQDHLIQLTGIKTALKEGETTFSDAFPEEDPVPTTQKISIPEEDGAKPAAPAAATTAPKKERASKPAASTPAPEGTTAAPAAPATPPPIPQTPEQLFGPVPTDPLEAEVHKLQVRDNIWWKQLYEELRAKNMAGRSAASLADLSPDNLQKVFENWDAWCATIKAKTQAAP